MKRAFIIGLLIFIFLISGCNNLVQEKPYPGYPSANLSYPSANLSYPAIAIHELKETKPSSGNFNIEGYVVNMNTCHCPEGAVCEPCKPNIVISENNLIGTFHITENELSIFVQKPEQFELGGKYKFSIKILDYIDYEYTGQPNLELLGYDLALKQKISKEKCLTDNDCGTGGCSGQICGPADKVKGIITTCEYSSIYDCYRITSCSCIDGKCQWRETKEFMECIGKIS